VLKELQLMDLALKVHQALTLIRVGLNVLLARNLAQTLTPVAHKLHLAHKVDP
jgi:hypothetical protein